MPKKSKPTSSSTASAATDSQKSTQNPEVASQQQPLTEKDPKNQNKAAEDNGDDNEDESAEEKTKETKSMDKSMNLREEAYEMKGDENKLNKAITTISDDQRQQRSEKLKRDQELLKVKVNKEDVELIMSELLVSKSQAERVLKENENDVVVALKKLVNA